MSTKIKKFVQKSKTKLKIGTTTGLNDDMDFEEVPSTPVTKYKNKRKLMQENLLNSSRSQRSGSSTSVRSNSRFANKLSGSFSKPNNRRNSGES